MSDEVGWLIEKKHDLLYGRESWWCGMVWIQESATRKERFYDFTTESTRAVRFARKKDAEAVIELYDLRECIATEHAWVGSLPDQAVTVDPNGPEWRVWQERSRCVYILAAMKSEMEHGVRIDGRWFDQAIASLKSGTVPNPYWRPKPVDQADEADRFAVRCTVSLPGNLGQCTLAEGHSGPHNLGSNKL